MAVPRLPMNGAGALWPGGQAVAVSASSCSLILWNMVDRDMPRSAAISAAVLIVLTRF